MCGGAATFKISLPDGTSIPAANLIEANNLLRTHQRDWPNEDLSIQVAASDSASGERRHDTELEQRWPNAETPAPTNTQEGS